MIDKRFAAFAARGLLTRISAFDGLRERRAHTGGTDSPDYCLSTWLVHLKHLIDSAGLQRVPEVLVELGPGDSCGAGLAFLLMGGRKYCAVDPVAFATMEKNLEVLGELAILLQDDAFLHESHIPPSFLSETALERLLSPRRIHAIAESVRRNDGRYFCYISANAQDLTIHKGEAFADLITSTAVLEHVIDPASVYSAAHAALKPGGLMAHQIDLTCHEMSDWWNGHWVYDDALWAFAEGRRPFTINRLSSSEHLGLVQRAGFELLKVQQELDDAGLPQSRFASRFRCMDPADALISSTYFVARRP